MKKILYLLIVSSALLMAKVITTYTIAEGVGNTRSEAIRDALIEVVKQTNGVSISSKRVYSKSITQSAIALDGDSSHGISISEKSKKRVYEATKGFISSYAIVGSNKENGKWYIKLKVKHKSYKTPGFSYRSRRKMAIFPFEYKNSYLILRKSEDGKEVSKRFTQAVISKLTQSRKFVVLDRENDRYYKAEKREILSNDSSKEELLKLCKRLGADYLVIGQILDLSIDKKNSNSRNDLGIPMSSETEGNECISTISYRILAMATGQIKWSQTLSFNFAIPDKKTQKTSEAILAYASDKISDKILQDILSNIYPPRIISVTANSIIINQGGNSIHKGSIYNAYKKGERLTDPYTGEYLGYEEIKAGKIVIDRVNPKISYGKLLEGVVYSGMILRKGKQKEKIKEESKGEATTDVKIAPGGGVILPFDK